MSDLASTRGRYNGEGPPQSTDARLADLERHRDALENALEEMSANQQLHVNDSDGDAPPPSTPMAVAEAPQPVFANLQAWVEGMFAPTFCHRLGSVHWCAAWWEHEEALLRLEALWRTWETMRLQPADGLARWLRDFLDPQLGMLLAERGPFTACDGENHHPAPPLPVLPAPPGHYCAVDHRGAVDRQDGVDQHRAVSHRQGEP